MNSKTLSIVVTSAVTITFILTVVGCYKNAQIPGEDQPILGGPVNEPILNVDDLVGKTPEEVEGYLGEPIGEPLIFEPGEDIYYSVKTSLYMYGYRTDRLSPLMVRYDFDNQKLLSLTVYFKTEAGLPEEDEALDLLNIDPGFSPTVIIDDPFWHRVRCDEGNVFMYDVFCESPDDKTIVSWINVFFIVE
jgi:hypothetical protein